MNRWIGLSNHPWKKIQPIDFTLRRNNHPKHKAETTTRRVVSQKQGKGKEHRLPHATTRENKSRKCCIISSSCSQVVSSTPHLDHKILTGGTSFRQGSLNSDLWSARPPLFRWQVGIGLQLLIWDLMQLIRHKPPQQRNMKHRMHCWQTKGSTSL